jgi:hypothetical protein
VAPGRPGQGEDVLKAPLRKCRTGRRRAVPEHSWGVAQAVCGRRLLRRCRQRRIGCRR